MWPLFHAWSNVASLQRWHARSLKQMALAIQQIHHFFAQFKVTIFIQRKRLITEAASSTRCSSTSGWQFCFRETVVFAYFLILSLRNHIPTYKYDTYIYFYIYVHINYHVHYQQAFYLVVHTGSSEAHKYHLNYSAESYWFQDALGLQVMGVVT